jgi:hypothetical protein
LIWCKFRTGWLEVRLYDEKNLQFRTGWLEVKLSQTLQYKEPS